MSAQSKLQELRSKVDEVNGGLLKLLTERATLVSEIGKLQSEMNSDFYDPAREAEMLSELQMKNEGPFSNDAIKGIFKEIFSASLKLEESEARAKLLVHRQSPDTNTVIEFSNGSKIGDGSFQVIAGSCAVENFEQIDTVGAALSERGINVMRGMAYKPRTSPYDFQGMGEEGLKIARKVANKYNMSMVTEIMDLSQIPVMDQYVDVYWVGARNMHNSFLLRALGKQNKPVILKRGLAATLDEFIYAAEYIVSSGNPNVILMERGIRTYSKWTRNTLDIQAVPLLKDATHLPVVVDISHCAGRRDIAETLAKIAKASGADGMMVEVHPNPAVAMSDAKQQVPIPQFHEIMDAIEAM